MNNFKKINIELNHLLFMIKYTRENNNPQNFIIRNLNITLEYLMTSKSYREIGKSYNISLTSIRYIVQRTIKNSAINYHYHNKEFNESADQAMDDLFFNWSGKLNELNILLKIISIDT